MSKGPECWDDFSPPGKVIGWIVTLCGAAVVLTGTWAICVKLWVWGQS